MKKLLILGALFAASVGCASIRPIGPLAQMQGLTPDGKTPEHTPEPIVREGPRPTTPAVYVTPSEVTTTNVDEALKRLNQELETDRRTMEAMPRYAEVSKLK